ncbi:MAG: SUMF1/EgtB/PvdO family nonheme iron enzyme [Phycisphaerae bacterium]|nr:SUMF1/EgtB/PvdO family nonheme iron enzyme [Phycisphaerae bacterium]
MSGPGSWVSTAVYDTGGQTWIWLKFDLSGLASGANIAKATIRPTVYWFYGTGITQCPVGLYLVHDDSWIAPTQPPGTDGINWENQPTDYDAQAIDSHLIDDYSDYAWDVTSAVRAEHRGDNVLSLLVRFVPETYPDHHSEDWDYAIVSFIRSSLNLNVYFAPSYEGTAPTVAIVPPATTHTNTGPIDFQVSYTGASSIDLRPADVLLNAGGTATGTIAVLNGDTPSPTIRISGITGHGTIGIDILPGSSSGANGYKDSGPGDTALLTTVQVDDTPPTVTISSPVASPTTGSTIPVNLVFSEKVAGLTPAAITVVNGSLASLDTFDDRVFRGEVSASAPGCVTIQVPAGVAQDAAGNDNAESQAFDMSYVLAPPSIALSQTYLINRRYVGCVEAPTQQIEISNAGSDMVEWNITTDVPWLICDPMSGISASGAPMTLSVSFNSDGLAIGVHVGKITVTSPNAANSPQTIEVTLGVAAPFAAADCMSWDYDKTIWFDAEDRAPRGPFNTYLGCNGLAENGFTSVEVTQQPQRKTFVASFEPQREKLDTYVMPALTGRSFPFYLTNRAFTPEDDYVFFRVQFCFVTYESPELCSGIGIGARTRVCQNFEVRIDGKWSPQAAGPFKGTVVCFPDVHNDLPWRWMAIAVARRVSPEAWSGIDHVDPSMWNTGDPQRSASGADLVIGNLSQGEVPAHTEAILQALQAGRTVVVNRGTYDALRSDPRLSLIPEEEGTVFRSLHFTRYATGVLVRSSDGLSYQGADDPWQLGWVVFWPFGGAGPISTYREVAQALNHICGLSGRGRDSDHDGMSDSWEQLYGLDPFNAADALLDPDRDGLTNAEEARPGTQSNPLLADSDSDGLSDGAEVNVHHSRPNDPDTDDDGIIDGIDNCPLSYNPDQADPDQDGIGEACEDHDNDGLPDTGDNCPGVANPDQADRDSDGVGDACDGCPDNVDKSAPGVCGCDVADQDSDEDSLADCLDNCPSKYNPNQADADTDRVGDLCDNCLSLPNIDQTDTDDDGIGDVCDNCLGVRNINQADTDHDGLGDACDEDDDGDGVPDTGDNCPAVANPDQADSDSDGVGDACEGEMFAWGNNNTGQCDVPSPNVAFVMTAGGGSHTLGLRIDGSIVAWGGNDDGECNVPAPNTGFRAIAAGHTFSLALRADGSIAAWGRNTSAQCDVPAPNSSFVAATGGGRHSLGLKGDGTVWAWGHNEYGQCDVPSPNTGFISIAAGDGYSLGLKADGSIVAWGDNRYGQCNVPAPNTQFVAVVSKYWHCLGLKSDGSIVAWGDNRYGQCNVPAPNTGFVEVAASAYHSLGLRSDGSIVTWGCGADGNRDQCELPSPNLRFIAVGAGGAHSLAIRGKARDSDRDGIWDEQDNCPNYNPDQKDNDGDGIGDACDACAGTLPGAAVTPNGCPPVAADLDTDGDVDQDDVGAFMACVTGPMVLQTAPKCVDADFDQDGDADQNDFGLLQRCYSGANVQTNLGCAGSAGPLVAVAIADSTAVSVGSCTALRAKVAGGILPYSFVWSAPGWEGSAEPNSQACPAVSTTYSLSVSDSSFPPQRASAAVTVTAIPPLVASAGADQETISLGDCTVLLGSGAGGIPPYSYSWSALEWTGSNAQNPLVCPTATTTYTLTVTDFSSPVQSAVDQVTITLQTPPPAGMVLIPAGEFQMGDPFNEGDARERPVHAVYVDAFFMDQYEVTNQQYADALNWANGQGLIRVTDGVVYKSGSGYPYCSTTSAPGDGPHWGIYSRITWNGSTFGVVSGKANHPMYIVSWYGAVAYANWRSEMQGRPPCYDLTTWNCNFGSGYRLPTEAEWEKAARGGATGHRFPWSDSDEIQHSRANYYSSSSCLYDTSPTRDYHPAFSSGDLPYTNPVDYFAPNAYGLYGTADNVFEWCNDRYSATYYQDCVDHCAVPCPNPRGPVSGDTRVVRGGSWYVGAQIARCSWRNGLTPEDRNPYGFRIVLGSP